MAVDFLPVANDAGANVIAQTDYALLLSAGHAMEHGYASGVVPSNVFNKTVRQSSMMTAAVANAISALVGASVLDDGVVATLQAQYVKSLTIGSKGATRVLGGATVLTSADAGKSILFSAGAAATLPSLATMRDGETIEFRSAIAGASVVRAGADTINVNAGTVTSLGLGAGDSLVLEASTTAGGWIATGGSAQLPFAAIFASLQAASGYAKLAGGIIIQWAIGSTITNPVDSTTQLITLPITFPTAILQSWVTIRTDTHFGGASFLGRSAQTTSSVTAYVFGTSGGGEQITPIALAIGY